MASSIDKVPTLELLSNTSDKIADWENIPPEDASTPSDVEDRLLAIIAIDQALDRLPSPFRALIELLYAYRASPGYSGQWPPTAQDVARYISHRFYQRRPVSVRTVWFWHEEVLTHWRRLRCADDAAESLSKLGLSAPKTNTLKRAA